MELDWTRRNDRTLVFDLDPRARWHDGTPFTTRDVLFSFERARNPKLAPSLARLLREVESVTADGERPGQVQAGVRGRGSRPR